MLFGSIVAFSSLIAFVKASPCVAFDSNFNLYVLGRGANTPDLNVGSQSSWANSNFTNLPTTGRPDFGGNNTQCALSQYSNVLYAASADTTSPTSLYVYNVASSQWSTQAIQQQNGAPNPETMTIVLDHDTNSYYAYDNGQVYELDLNTLTQGSSSALSYQASNVPPFQGAQYSQATVGIAQNHLYFIGTPNSNSDLQIFVIHFAYWQPTLQAYSITAGGSGNPPSTHGKTASFLDAKNNVPQKFAYVPDDGSATYVINVETNSTQQFAGPTVKDASAVYAASPTTLVQYSSQGLYYLDTSASSPQWVQIKNVPGGSSSSTTNSTQSSSPSGSSSATGTSPSSTTSGQAASGSGSSSSSSSAGHAITASSSFLLLALAMLVICL